MKIQSLTGAWEFRQAGMDEWLRANVPGGVHTDLLALGRIPDPFVGDNEKKVQWVAEADWEYRRQFRVEPERMSHEHIFLVCDGLDTLATVSLNGNELGRTANMFRQYRWEVKSLLKPEGNELSIKFDSPVKYAANQQAKRFMLGVPQGLPGAPHLRKAPCQFGWDWGPQLPPIGIWKEIRLEGYDIARIEEVHLQQEHTDGHVVVKARIEVERWEEQALTAVMRIITPGNELLEKHVPLDETDEALVEIQINKPELWWLNGYGNHPLYQVEVSFTSGETTQDKLLDVKKYQMGLRTVELRQDEDQWGRSFVFVVNGVRILVKGANWIPAESFPTRITETSLERLIRSAAETHQNMLRVWGGGFYEDERFYDLCDKYGILVWQEFIFACSVYPLDELEYLENMHQEVIENVRRLRHRASLALWCGNNEMEWGLVDWVKDHPELEVFKPGYELFFHQILRDWCLAEDPDTTYWPSSPSSGTAFLDPNGQKQGDAHYWDVWHKRQPFTAYRGQYPRFMSEFGFQALPPLETIRTYADEADWNMTSYIMEQHQKNLSGNSLMVGQMLDTFQLPKDFESLVYASMVLQAEGIRYGVEHWRRHPERVAGMLYWQLNDCWPVASWSSLDYFGRWKALHYAARRFYAPVMLSIEDNPPEQAIYLSNDNLKGWEGSVDWSLETLDGEKLTAGRMQANVAAQSANQVGKLDFSGFISDSNIRRLVFVAELRQEERLIARQTAYFVPVKHLSLAEPALNAKVHMEMSQLVIDITAESLAVLVEVSLPGSDVVFSDNYFNLPAGRTARISCPLPDSWSVEKAQRALRLRSVYDSYAHLVATKSG